MTESQTASLSGTGRGFTIPARFDAPLDPSGGGSTRRCLLDLQQPDGHWVGELQGDPSSNPNTSC